MSDRGPRARALTQASTHAGQSDEHDRALMLRVQAHDADAFGELYDRLGARALRLAGAVTRDRSHTEDVVQEAFLSAWRSRARYRPDAGTVAAWLLGIVRYRAVDSLRHHEIHARRRAARDVGEEMEAAGSVEGTAAERDVARRLRARLARLPAPQREVIVLAYFGELSTREISQQLSLPLGTVKGRIRLGLERLRRDDYVTEMGRAGLEPATSALSRRRSPS